MQKIRAGVLGATGMVGQWYVSLLENHPWFEVTYAAASPRSAGKKYAAAVEGRYLVSADIPKTVCDLTVGDANNVSEALGKCDFVFSALEMEKSVIAELEESYAAAGIPVVSNASAHRWTLDVPMLIPEINPDHTDIIASQQKKRGWKKGFIVVKPNCSIQSYMAPVHALQKAGYPVGRIIVTTMQAVSGAGYPGVPSLDIIDNIVPFISGEEEKSEREPLKIFGAIADGEFRGAVSPRISAHCNRVPLSNGHTACVSMEFALPNEKKPSLETIKKIWTDFSALPQQLKLPSAPAHAIIVRGEQNRPQPARDRETENGMAVVVGRLRPCNVFDARFAALSHNTKRGAALGGILNAELLKAKGFFNGDR